MDCGANKKNEEKNIENGNLIVVGDFLIVIINSFFCVARPSVVVCIFGLYAFLPVCFGRIIVSLKDSQR
jgi:hypothetical protein